MKFLLLFLLSTSAFAQFTALPPLPPVENAILTKGGLLTSDGTAQVEALACADDELIVFDSAEANGFKCAPAPSGGVSYICRRKFLTSSVSASISTTYPANGTVLVSVPIEIGKVYFMIGKAHSGSGGVFDLTSGGVTYNRSMATASLGVGTGTRPFVATSTTAELRAANSVVYAGTNDIYKNNFTWLELCEITSASVTFTEI